MTGARPDGRSISVTGSFLLLGTDSEIRGFLEWFLVNHGLDEDRVPRIIKRRRSQKYNDRKAALAKGFIRPEPPRRSDLKLVMDEEAA